MNQIFHRYINTICLGLPSIDIVHTSNELINGLACSLLIATPLGVQQFLLIVSTTRLFLVQNIVHDIRVINISFNIVTERWFSGFRV